MDTKTVEIHDDLHAHFHGVTDTGFGSLRLLPGLNGQGTLYATPVQAKKLADAIYQQLGLKPVA